MEVGGAKEEVSRLSEEVDAIKGVLEKAVTVAKGPESAGLRLRESS